MDWLLWIDIETTGVDPINDKILQIAYNISSVDLSTFYQFSESILYCDETSLSNMNDWCITQHTKSGLYDKVQYSDISTTLIEQQILLHINSHLTVRDTLYLAGNSVHFDKSFIQYHMPNLYKRLSHKILDVSSIGLLCKNLHPVIYSQKLSKQNNHTASSDLTESIYEYQFYLNNLIKN
jgi:oligoribonuclease